MAWIAFALKAEESRVSLERDEPVWSIDFGALKGKPARVTRQHFVPMMQEWNEGGNAGDA